MNSAEFDLLNLCVIRADSLAILLDSGGIELLNFTLNQNKR